MFCNLQLIFLKIYLSILNNRYLINLNIGSYNYNTFIGIVYLVITYILRAYWIFSYNFSIIKQLFADLNILDKYKILKSIMILISVNL